MLYALLLAFGSSSSATLSSNSTFFSLTAGEFLSTPGTESFGKKQVIGGTESTGGAGSTGETVSITGTESTGGEKSTSGTESTGETEYTG